MTSLRESVALFLALAVAPLAPAQSFQIHPCASSTGWVQPKALEEPDPGDTCVWEWRLKMDPLASASHGPVTGPLGLSGSVALAQAWGMQISALGHAWNLSGAGWILCTASKSGAGSLSMTFLGPATPPCAPRIEADWRPLWRWELHLDPPGHVVLGGRMKGISQCPSFTVDAQLAPALSATRNTPFQVCIGPVCIPVTVFGGAGGQSGEVVDIGGGISFCELGHFSWLGATSAYGRAEGNLFNWFSEVGGEICGSDPGLEIVADCVAPYCPGTTRIEYKK